MGIILNNIKKTNRIKMNKLFIIATILALGSANLLTIIPQENKNLEENATHYGNPTGGCQSDEIAAQVTGISGAACFPACDASGGCPSDVPSGVTATPFCVLQTGDGSQYCTLICSGIFTGDCDTGATCESLSGIGLCMYQSFQNFLGN